MSMATKYHQIFMAELVANSQTDYPLEEWKYIGGNQGRHARWYQNLYPDMPFLEVKTVCICSHPIVENCYIQNKQTQQILIVGNCCIKRFLPIDSQGCSCPKCDQPHQNRIADAGDPEIPRAQARRCPASATDPWCNDCRGGIVTLGHHRGKSYRWILERDPSYAQFVVDLDHCSGKLWTLSKWFQENGITPTKKQYVKFRNNYPPKKSIKKKTPLTFSSAWTHPQKKMSFGKHRNKTYRWVLNNDTGYCRWILNIKHPSPQMKLFQDWLINNTYLQ